MGWAGGDHVRMRRRYGTDDTASERTETACESCVQPEGLHARVVTPDEWGYSQIWIWIGIQLRRKSSQKQIYRKSVVDLNRFRSKSKQI